MSDAPRSPVPAGPVPSRAEGQRLLDLVKVMYRLRGPGGCPWDREQTHQSLARHLLEEMHETLAAIDSGDPAQLREELGDLLLQVLFHAEIADEEGAFDIDDVAEAVTAKLVRRHPHVFGEVRVESASEVLHNWESIKAEERGDRPLADGIPATLPALARASKVQRRAAAFGFDWRSEQGAVAKVFEELAELQAAPPDRAEEEVGDVLFAVASLARMIGVDPESALRRTTARFSARFDEMKVRARREGVHLQDLNDDELLARFRAAR